MGVVGIADAVLPGDGVDAQEQPIKAHPLQLVVADGFTVTGYEDVSRRVARTGAMRYGIFTLAKAGENGR
ncbi:hypothetical protein [Arthrobacter sp. HS15c]|uniref:hypothetical protein n=1 Tax=Arthrobacter sp. HS15c TaxID=3230279 RepID=UPI00346556BD